MYPYFPPMSYSHMSPVSNYDPYEIAKALELVKDAIEDEKNDEMFYNALIEMAPTNEEKEIIRSISNDEKKHNKMFKKIYSDFTGVVPKTPEKTKFEKPTDYLTGIKKALFGELKAVEKYRQIRKNMPNRYYRDMLFEIITDELKHSGKYNYIYTINSAKDMDQNKTIIENGKEILE